MSEKVYSPQNKIQYLIVQKFIIFGKNYLPVLNCTKIFFLIFGMDDSPLVQCQVEHEVYSSALLGPSLDKFEKIRIKVGLVLVAICDKTEYTN